MSTATRIDFQKSCQLPTPWKALNQTAPHKSKVQTDFTLRRIECARPRSSKSAAVRSVLREELNQAAGRPVLWVESAKGPEVRERIRDRHVGVSISYAKTEAWLALGWEAQIGVDAVAIEEVPDWEEVASVYLEQAAQERLRKSTQPALDFAREWAGFEARLKLAGQPLVEGLAPPPALLYGATFGAVYVAVALGSGPTLRR